MTRPAPHNAPASTSDNPMLEEVLAEILAQLGEIQAVQKQEIAAIRRTLELWQENTHGLTRLLETKTQETKEVSDCYRTLSGQLIGFSSYLAASETMWKRVEPMLQNLADRPLPLASPSTSQVDLGNLMKLSTATHQKAEAILSKVGQQNRSRSVGTSIWTELAVWRAALVWVGVGAVAASVLHWGVFRSGFWLALGEIRQQGATVEEVRDRLARLEVWLGISEEAPE